jgi:3' terminal RNA ribose 2'-O-methyltransferase Hen1
LLLTISTSHRPATDLGYLLHKNPGRAHVFDLPVGKAHVFYPQASEELCTAALLLEIDPITLVRTARRASLRQYVNDRPYVASSFMSTALLKVFGTAMSGSSKDRPQLAATAIPLTVTISALPCRGGEDLLRRLFEPLGYEVSASVHLLDHKFPEWGLSPYLTVRLEGTHRVADTLQHLYVLIPTLDDEKHYWIGRDEVDKLMNRGGEWLASHPQRDLIIGRYLKGLRTFTSEALERLTEEGSADGESNAEEESGEEVFERSLGLGAQRVQAVIAQFKRAGAKRVLDMGCGEGRLLRSLLEDPTFEEIVGMDVSIRALQRARERLRLDRMPEAWRARLRLMHSSLTYRDGRLTGFDAAAVIEVVEHFDPRRLAAFERSLFEFARPTLVVVTTPNAEYNVRWPSLPAGELRHEDHRFEWTRAEFEAWAAAAGRRFGYEVRFEGVGADDPEVGCPTQLGVFSR